MIPDELKHEYEQVPQQSYSVVKMYKCKHCGSLTAHPELNKEYVCPTKDRRTDIRRTIDRENNNIPDRFRRI